MRILECSFDLWGKKRGKYGGQGGKKGGDGPRTNLPTSLLELLRGLCE